MKYFDILRLKVKNYIVVDNFFPEEICSHLQNLTLTYDRDDIETWSNYQAINFDNDYFNLSLRMIADDFVFPKVSFIKKESYIRSWSLRFNTFGTGVGPHTDPSHFTVNVWVTPDKCMGDPNKNGLIIYKKKRPKGPWEEYSSHEKGWSMEKIRDYLKESKYDIIPYRFNRAIIFMGDSFHETCDVEMKPGVNNCRVSYTFLYEK